MTTGTDRGAAADETRKAMPETRLPKAPKVTKWGGRAARERGRLPLLPACIPVEKRGAEKRRSVQGSPNKGVETGEIGERLRERRDGKSAFRSDADPHSEPDLSSAPTWTHKQLTHGSKIVLINSAPVGARGRRLR